MQWHGHAHAQGQGAMGQGVQHWSLNDARKLLAYFALIRWGKNTAAFGNLSLI